MDTALDDTPPPELLLPVPRRARRRAWGALGAAALGAAIAHELPGVPLAAWMLAALAVGTLLLITPRRLTGPALLLGLVLLGAWWFDLRTSTACARSPQILLGIHDRQLIEGEGLVLSRARDPSPHRDRLARFRRVEPVLSFDLSLTALLGREGPTPARGQMRVSVSQQGDDPGPLPQPGERVRFKGWYSPPRGPMNPGQTDPRPWMNMEGQVGSVFLSSSALLVRLEPRARDGRASWVRLVSGVRERMLDQVNAGDHHARGHAVLAALLLGEIDPALRDTRSAFQKSGTAHLLAISGFHLAVLCGLGVLLVRLTGDRGALEVVVVGALVLGLLVLVPARVPIVRAGVLVLALLTADALGRRYDRLTLLAWIALGLLVWRPMDLFSLGAQLSVGITALLIWLSGTRHPWVVPSRIRGLRPSRRNPARATLRWLRSYVVVCILCWAFAFPVVAHHTGVLSFAGPVATALVTPLVVVLLAAGYLALMIGTAAPDAGAWILDHLAAGAEVVANVVERFSAVPALSFEVAPPSALWAGTAVLTLCVYVGRARLRDARVVAALALALGLLAIRPMFASSLSPRVALRVDTLAVGDGTCHIVRSGADALVWDCGSLRSDLRTTLERARAALGLAHARLGAVTHANLDHFVSMPDAAELLGVERVLVSPHVLTDPGRPERAFLELLADIGVEVVPVRRGDEVPFGRGSLVFLWPDESAERLASNDRSLVCRVAVPTRAGEKRLLLTGDIQSEAIAGLLADPAQLRADVLEIPHHGSFRTEAMSFLAAVDPAVVIQSTGSGRAGDPRWADHRASRTWFTTATDGAVWVEIRTDGRITAGSVR